MIRISAVIPTHNRAACLPRALDSVYAQSEPPHECLVVDDGSTDDPQPRLRAAYPQATWLRQGHRGVSAARNLGIERACGDWVAFLDSDDCWMPDKLARQRRAVEHSGLVICHSDEIWIRHGRRVNPMRKHRKRGGWIYRHCLPRCAISPSTAMVRRDVLLAAGGFDESLPACEDYDLWLRLCARFPVLYLERPLATRYAGHADQLSSQYWGMDRFRVAALEKLLAGAELSETDRRLTLETLVAKLAVLVGGARKRGHAAVIDAYQPRLERYRRRLAVDTAQAAADGDA